MTNPSAPIAIVGMACTFPGARDLRQYWENILAKVDAVGDAPPDWESQLYYDPESEENDRTYCRRGGFLGALGAFDPAEYGVMPQAVDGTEPDHFLALRAAGEAMADAGYRNNPKHRERTSIVIGRGTYVNRGNSTALQHSLAVDGVLRVLRQLHPEHTPADLAAIRTELKKSLPPFHADTAAGLVPNVISGRIANRLDIMGANYIVDAACASSLVAVDLAVQDLRSGRCDMAVAGGVHASTTPVILIIFSQLKALSRAGRIRPFSADADGTLLGEGVGMVVLRRLEDAERDGDKIYAVIRGIGVASDGRALGLLAPRLEGEVLALRRAYEAAAIDPASVELIEAHGTATLVGDAVEVDALKQVLGGRRGGDMPRCALGSVKSMISHTMPAAGMAGLIKTALALHHKVLPPTLHCENPNPKLGIEGSNFYLNAETRPWIHGADEPRRAGVNAFGFGGINAHAVLEEYVGPHVAAPLQHTWDSEAIVLSAPDLDGLRREVDRIRKMVTGASLPLSHLAWTLNCQQPRDAVRLGIVASSAGDLAAKLERAGAKLAEPRTARIRDKEGIYYFREPLAQQGKLAILFPGEGAQYVNMLADLAVHFPEVRSWFDLMDTAFADHARGYRPSDAVFPAPMGGTRDRLFSMDVGAEAVFAGNQALFALLEKLELRADAMVGHSTGEHSALLSARVMGAQSREELIAYVLGVNGVFEKLNAAGKIREGVLLAVAGAEHAFLAGLVASRPDLHIALDNCPHQVVICGSEKGIEFVLASLQGKPAVCQRLPMGRAYHTPLFENFAAGLRQFLETVPVAAPAVDLYSCVTAGRYPAQPGAIRDLAASQWASAVRFRETIEVMHQDGVRLFVECGPRGNLCTFLDDTLRSKPYAAVPANLMHRSGITQLNHLCAMLLAHGVEMDLGHLYARRAPELYPAAHPPRPSRAMPIASGLQPLRLPEGFRLPNQGHAEPTAVAAAPAPPPQAPAPPPVAGRAAVMQQYLANMTSFLGLQQKALSAYLGSGTQSTGVAAPAVASTRPFVTETVEIVPGRRAVVRHRFTLNRDRLFAHHTLGRTVSDFDPSLTGIPVVPLTVTMELLAEAASVLMPNQVLRGMKEVRSSRWITLDRDLTIEMVAEAAAEPGAVTVRLRAADGPALAVWAEGTMLFGPAYPAAPSPRPAQWRGAKPSAWRTDRLYVDGMFHGPSFMAVSAMGQTGEDGGSATLTALPRHELVAGQPSPAFLTDPVILDATGQAVAFWSQEKLDAHGDIFPYRLEHLDCYQPPQEPGTTFDCRIFVTSVTETSMSSDIEVVDGQGRLHYRMRGWHDRRFQPPRSQWDLRISSGRTFAGRLWPEPVASWNGAANGPAGATCYLVDDLPSALLESSHGIWAEVLAWLILSRREREQWERLRTAIPKRRFEWLRGRCAAKDAVRHLVNERTGTMLAAADVELMPDAHGKPQVEGPWISKLGVAPAVSISHSGEAAAAVATLQAGAAPGFDLETAGQERDGFERIAFDDTERSVLDPSLAAGARREWHLRMWCAKEAAAKALGRGFEHGLRSLAVVRIDAGSGQVHLEARRGLAETFPRLRSLTAHTSRGRGFIAAAVLREENDDR